MTLPDKWIATTADDELRRAFADPDFDDGGWEPVTVPGHWRTTSAFADNDDPLLYRTSFEQASGPPTRRWWLELDGIFSQGDVWLDGGYLGDTEGYFVPHSFEITDQLRQRAEHTLAIEVTSPPTGDPRTQRTFTGTFQAGEASDPSWNPGGIWRPVRLAHTGPVRIGQLVTRCTTAGPDRAVLTFQAVLDASGPVAAHVRTTVGGVDHGVDHPLAAGDNVVEWTVTVDRPQLWWPHALGDPHLETVTVEVRLADRAGSQVSDRRRFRTGLRTVHRHRGAFHVNGERIFAKGVHLGPARLDLGDASTEECTADVIDARALGLDMVRLHGHVARPETYDAADEAGMLVWQDMPLVWGYARTVRKQAVRQARAMVAMLAHHPSIVVWCGHDDPTGPGNSGGTRTVASQVPSWNISVLDRALDRALTDADGTRPVIRHSGVVPHLPRLAWEDSHLRIGSGDGDIAHLARRARTVPNQVRFPTLLGPTSGPSGPAPNDSDAAYDRQASTLKASVELLRRLKYHPTVGFSHGLLRDAWPTESRSLRTVDGSPKPALDAFRAACRPVIAVADPLPERVQRGDHLHVAVHVVSDARLALTGELTVTATWPGGSSSWGFAGDIDADSCTLVGMLHVDVPEDPHPSPAPPGVGDGAPSAELVLTIAGRVGEHDVANEYRTHLVG